MSRVPNGSHDRFAGRRLLATTGIRAALAALVGLASLGSFRPANAADTSPFFYSGGQKHALKSSTGWVAVELEAGADASSVVQSVRALGAVDKSAAVASYAKKPILIFKSSGGSGARVAGAKGVRRVLRTFASGKSPIVETDEILVNFKKGVSKSQAAALLQANGAVIVAKLGDYAPNGYRARVTSGAALDAANALYGNANVAWSHPNFIWPKQKRFVPNDPLYANQWHLNNSGQGGGTAGADVKAQAAWDITRGSTGIIVAITDDAIDTDHVELGGAKLVPGKDYVNNDNDPRPVAAADNHGTSCAGVAVGAGHNGVGTSGIAPNCKLMPIRLVGTTDLDNEAAAFTFAANNGAHIISNSWGPDDNAGPAALPDNVRDAINFAATSGRGGKGCIIVWAAGNGNESCDNDGYAANPTVITVAATTNQDVRASYSDFGAAVDVCAPSSGGTIDILTVDRTGAVGYSPANGYSNADYTNDFGGTSSACPLVAGVAALMLSVNPDLTRVQVQTILQNTADKVDTAGGAYVSGRSNKYGYGRVNALRAVQEAAPATRTISGRIADAGNIAISGVTVGRTGSATTVLTNANGEYTLTGVPAGSFTVTPTKASTTFNPVNRSVTVTTANVTGQNFTGTVTPPATFNISGRIADAGNLAIAGVTVGRTGSATTVLTSASGEYTLTGVPAGTYTVTPTKAGCTFNPATRSVTVTNANVTAQNFTGTVTPPATFNISGRIADAGNLAIAGVTVGRNGSATTVQTNANGEYVLTSVPAGTFTVTPSKAGCTFSPTTRSVTVTNANVAAQNFTGTVTAATFNISGRIADAGNVAIAAVTVGRTGSATTVQTNANGEYVLTGVPAGTYTVTPSKANTSFNPATRSVTVTNANVTAQNFTGTPTDPNALYTITGRISSGANGLPNVSVARTGGAAVLTNGAGYYTFTGVMAGTYTITPTLAGNVFDPGSRSVTITSANAVNQNFVALTGYSISGRVSNSAGAAVVGAVISRTGSAATVQTNSAGYYTLPNVPNGTYTITATLAGNAFTPATRSVTVAGAAVANQNFIASAGYTIAGRIANSAGTGLAGVTVGRTGSVATVVTNGAGYYTFAGVPNGTYTVTPTSPNFNFTPVTRSVTVNGATTGGHNFIGTPK